LIKQQPPGGGKGKPRILEGQDGRGAWKEKGIPVFFVGGAGVIRLGVFSGRKLARKFADCGS